MNEEPIVIRRLGAGGFGVVEEIECKGIRYARKFFNPPSGIPDELVENVRKRFRNEVKIQSAIVHDNIVPILSSDLESDPPNYIMPKATCSLADELANGSKVRDNFISILSQVVAGLGELHSIQIYHRDLKPQNILRFDDGDRTTYSISDFGLISLRESSMSSLTTTDMQKGSDFYTAPEIAQNLKSASVQSDIYSLGCLIHDFVGTAQRIPCGEIRESGAFDAILLGCTRKNPRERFGSVREVLDAVLSIEFQPAVAESQTGQEIVQHLNSNPNCESDFWEATARFLEAADQNDIDAICGILTRDQIGSLSAANPEDAKCIGLKYSEWVSRKAFVFDHCDGIANRAEQFFHLGDLELKCAILFSLLEMGTSHNRWYVERMFKRLTGPDMPPDLAKRFNIEIRVKGKKICAAFDHLEWSISAKRTDLHPQVQSALEAVCG